MATSGEETTFPYPDPLFNDWLFKLREYLPGYKGPIFTCEFHNWLLREGVNVAYPSLFAGTISLACLFYSLLTRYTSAPKL